MPHVIRLRGPWLYEVIEGDCRDRPRQGKVQMPTDWSDTLGSDFRGRVKCTRHFGLPTGLDEQSVVVMAVGTADAKCRWTLNGEVLTPADTPTRFHIRDRLQPRNQLCVEITLPADGPACQVQLEIGATSAG